MSAARLGSLEITDSADVAHARHVVRGMAATLGFDNQTTEEVVLAVSELATNLVKHAQRGTLLFHRLESDDRSGMEIESIDQGPGIASVEEALTDGYSTTGSLGCGLGTVNRLMDWLDIHSVRGNGTRLVCRRWQRGQRESPHVCPVAFGAATRAVAPLEGNGDSFVIKRWDENALVAVIDGLGHGRLAERAAKAARLYVESHYDQPLMEIFRGTDRACRATRGVVMTAARFDWRAGTFSLACIGNIETRIFGAPKGLSFVVRRGVLGNNAPNPVVAEHFWQPGYVLVLHSDGVSGRWAWTDFPDLAEAPAALVADRLLRTLARTDDDATVVVVRDDLP